MWSGLAVGALVPRVLAAVLRPAWHDEYFTCWAASLPWAKLLEALRVDSGPPFLYVLVKLLTLTRLAPLPAARLVAVAAGTAAVLLAARAARQAFGEAAGWLVGTLLAFHPLAVAWSAEGRAYALLLLAGAWAWDRLESLAHGGGGAAGLGMAVALACWSHTLGLLLAAVSAFVALMLSGPARRRAILAVAAGFASHLPWLPVAAHQPPAAIAWMATYWQGLSTWERVVAPLRLLSPLGAFGATLDLPSPPWWLELAGAVLVLALLLDGCRGVRRPRRALLGFLLPAAALVCLAALGVPLLYPGRAESLYLVPFALVLVAGAPRSRGSRVATLAACVAAAAVSGVAIVGWARRPPSPERRLAAAIRERLPEGGEVVVGGYWRLGIDYHLGAARSRILLSNYPASAATHPGWYDPSSERPTPDELDTLRTRLQARAGRTAVVVTPGITTAAELERLGAALGLRPALSVTGGQLLTPVPGAGREAR